MAIRFVSEASGLNFAGSTAELSELEGPAAKRRLEELLRSGPIRIAPRRDVYDRLLADVFVNEQNVAAVLAQEDHAKLLKNSSIAGCRLPETSSLRHAPPAGESSC